MVGVGFCFPEAVILTNVTDSTDATDVGARVSSPNMRDVHIIVVAIRQRVA